ncbi:MAG: hypothetical protein KAY46_26280 [Burkholderiaceae bacterium]|nr:hypothetical protein [Burkholderiaceae bacterium]
MSLKLTVDTLDDVPENLRSLYAEADGKFRLAVDGIEDTAGLKSALQKEREAARTAEKQAKAWMALGKTPEEIAALVDAQRKADEEKAVKGGEFDKLKAQMVEQSEREKTDLRNIIKSKDAAIERYLIDAQATAAISEMKGIPVLLLPHVKAAVKVVEDNGDFVTRVVDAQGNPRVNSKGEFLSIRDLVDEMRQNEVFGRAFEPTGATGSGAGGSGGGSAKTMAESAFNALSPKDRAKRMAEGYRVI